MKIPLKYRIQGLRLLIDSQLSRTPPHERKETVLPVDEGLPTDIYLPPLARRRQNGRNQGVILFIHGMAPRGQRDERIISLSGILAGLGYIVVAPRLQEVADLKISVDTIGRLAEVIKVLTADKKLCPTGRVGLIAPSFSGALALSAAGRPDVAGLISSICTIGPPAEMLSSLDFFMGRDDADPYAYQIVLFNFLHFAVGKRKALIEALRLSAEDDGMHREGDDRKLPAYLATLSARDRKAFDEILSSKEVRLKHWQAIRPKLQKYLTGIMPLEVLPNVRAKLTLVHGMDDNVIAPDQSELLYRECRRHGIPALLELTPLISHGDHSVHLSMVKDAFDLAGAFGHFVQHV